MERMTNTARLANAKGWVEYTKNDAEKEEQRRAAGDARLTQARARAQRLAAQLAPLFPVVSSATKTPGGLEGWCDSWARQILSAALSDQELLQGLEGVCAAAAQAGNPPLSFSIFLAACRPHSHLTGQDMEARRRHSLLLTRDRTQDKGWCEARDRALAKLREMGALPGTSSD
jgi:hypothetical protein